LDREILGYVEPLLAGSEFQPETVDTVALIREGVQEGSFIGVSDTVTRFRDFFLFPEIFRHWNLGTWRANGATPILDESWARAQVEIARSKFRLPDDACKEIDNIYQKAQGRILKH
jgi:trimethylamine:corrinoid methyltransferase-like protein